MRQESGVTNSEMHIRVYTAGDRAEWGRMRTALWADQTAEDMSVWIARSDAVVVVAERSPGALCGFAEVGERSHADGCVTTPVAYLEGWYVDEDVRRRGIGSALVHAAERWAIDRGYRELASDVVLDNLISQCAHERLRFAEVCRVVYYVKELGSRS